MVPIGDHAGVIRQRLELGPQPVLLLAVDRARHGPAVVRQRRIARARVVDRARVEDEHVPAGELPAVVARRRVAGRVAEIGVVARRRVAFRIALVLVVAHGRVHDLVEASPGGVEDGVEVRELAVLVLVVAEHRDGVGIEALHQVGRARLAAGGGRLDERGPAGDVTRGHQRDRVGWRRLRFGSGRRRGGGRLRRRLLGDRRGLRRLRRRPHTQPTPYDQATRSRRERVATGGEPTRDPHTHPEASTPARAQAGNRAARDHQTHPRARREAVPGHRDGLARRHDGSRDGQGRLGGRRKRRRREHAEGKNRQQQVSQPRHGAEHRSRVSERLGVLARPTRPG